MIQANNQVTKLSFIVPAYNEERTVRELLTTLTGVDLGDVSKEIIVINDCSKDKTLEIVEAVAHEFSTNASTGAATSFIVLSNEVNRGKSQSVKRGILASSGDLVVVQDADLEYEPTELAEFVAAFQADPELDVIYGNRFGKKNKVVYWQNWFGNRFLTLVSNLFTGRHGFWLSDMETCYKMVRGDVMREIAETIESTSNFGFEPEVTAKLAKHRPQLKLKQIPITYRPRTIAEGKHMKAFQDGFKALKEIIVFNLSK